MIPYLHVRHCAFFHRYITNASLRDDAGALRVPPLGSCSAVVSTWGGDVVRVHPAALHALPGVDAHASIALRRHEALAAREYPRRTRPPSHTSLHAMKRAPTASPRRLLLLPLLPRRTRARFSRSTMLRRAVALVPALGGGVSGALPCSSLKYPTKDMRARSTRRVRVERRPATRRVPDQVNVEGGNPPPPRRSAPAVGTARRRASRRSRIAPSQFSAARLARRRKLMRRDRVRQLLAEARHDRRPPSAEFLL